MISVEQRFYSAFPALSEGAARAFSRPVVDLLRRVVCEERVNLALQALRDTRDFDFVEAALEHLQQTYRVGHLDRANIPSEGRVVIVANHPLGAIDALALLHLVGSVRRDVKVLANEVLMSLAPLRDLLVPVEVFGDNESPGGLRAAYRALEQEQALIVFPAGEVSRIRPNGVRDGRWSAGFLRFAKRMGAPVLPVHIAAHNSPMFYGLSMLAKPLATLMLPREMFKTERRTLTLTVGAQIPTVALHPERLNERQIAQRMRAHVYRLARRKPPMFATSSAIAHPQPPLLVRTALQHAERLGATRDGKHIYLLDAAPDNIALKEIGRLRELSFRKVGEGTGLKRDLDRFDAHYRHIVLWDEPSLEIVGAYRVADCARVLERFGLEGLYSNTLFHYQDGALDWLRHSIELGRSFVQPRYWGSRSLDYLWQGIGAYLRRHPQVRYLLGPVSLSASLPESAREWIVATHAACFPPTTVDATARSPVQISAEVALEAQQLAANPDLALQHLRERLSAMNCALPTLYRQYVDLCESDGVNFLAFSVDADFGHCIDGLIRIDLQRLRPQKRTRYLGSTSSD
ncbi:MAG: lysophospholipid acyltransferase family protein [Xanthomonadales bacterium]|nr:lysophospholipid acyltransferase family protein [Xanthomonadales bacterium]